MGEVQLWKAWWKEVAEQLAFSSITTFQCLQKKKQTQTEKDQKTQTKDSLCAAQEALSNECLWFNNTSTQNDTSPNIHWGKEGRAAHKALLLQQQTAKLPGIYFSMYTVVGGEWKLFFDTLPEP